MTIDRNLARPALRASAAGKIFFGFYLQPLNVISILGKFAHHRHEVRRKHREEIFSFSPFIVPHFSYAVFRTLFFVGRKNILEKMFFLSEFLTYMQVIVR